MPSTATTISTEPIGNQRRSLKQPAGATAAESSSTWRNRERPQLRPRRCGASMNCLRSSAPSTDKRRSNGLPRAMRNRDRSSSISKSGCASSVPCSHQATTLRRRSTISSTAGRRSPASSTTVVFVCRTMRPNEPCAVWRWEERIGPSPVQTSARLTAHLAISL